MHITSATDRMYDFESLRFALDLTDRSIFGFRSFDPTVELGTHVFALRAISFRHRARLFLSLDSDSAAATT